MLLQQQFTIDVLDVALWLGLFFPSELCLCFMVYKYILNRVNLNQANTSHFKKHPVKCFNFSVVIFFLHSRRKSFF